MSDYPQSKHSWTLLSDSIAVKKMDKSSFLHHGTGIPKEFVPHFTSGTPVEPEGYPITLACEGRQYPARFQYDVLKQRVRLFWKADFADLLRSKFPKENATYSEDKEVDDPPLMMLTRADEQIINVAFIESPSDKDDWSNLEIEAAVVAYFSMLRKEQAGNSYSKAEMNRLLRDAVLSSRNKQSVEYRMANISSVLEELCHPTITGYKSRGHVGAGVSSKIRAAIEKFNLLSLEDYEPTADKKELAKRTNALRKRGIVGKPAGQIKPRRISSESTTYERDPAVRAWVLEHAQGKCELCGSPAPFIGRDFEPFMECHHVEFLADGGEDTVENSVALCPNCHREAHYSSDIKGVAMRIRRIVSRTNNQKYTGKLPLGNKLFR